MEGTVKWFNVKKGFGFIKGEDDEDYFVHFSAIDKGTFIRENDRVSFEAVQTERGKQAQNVVLLQKGSEIAREGQEEPQEEQEEGRAEEEQEEKQEEQETEDQEEEEQETEDQEEEQAEEKQEEKQEK